MNTRGPTLSYYTVEYYKFYCGIALELQIQGKLNILSLLASPL